MAKAKQAKVAALGSIEECNEAMRALLLVTTEIEKLTAWRDEAAAAAMEPFDALLQTVREQAKELEEQLHTYYMAHLAEIEKGGTRSLRLLYGVIGRRFGNIALRLLNRSWTWETAREAVRVKWGIDFLAFQEPEINKDKVKAEIPEERLSECGLKLHQEERFYAEPDRPTEGAV